MRKYYLAVSRGKYTKYTAGYVGLNSRSSGSLGRVEVDIRLEEKSVVGSSFAYVRVKISMKLNYFITQQFCWM
jgi:hypothetical protein